MRSRSRMWKYIKGYEKESVLAPLFKMLEAFFDLFVPLVVARIIDIGVPQGDRRFILGQTLILVALALIGMLCSFTAQYFAARASVGYASHLRSDLFKHVLSLGPGEWDALGQSTLITRLTSDIQQIQNGLNMGLRLLLRSPFIVFGAMIMAFTIDVPSALIFAVAIPVLSVVVFGIMLLSIPLFRKVQAGLDAVLERTRENLTGVRVLRAFGKEESEIAEFRSRSDALTRLNKFVGRLSALMNPATYVLINLATIWLIRTGALRVNAGILSQGDVVALYNYMAQIIVELIKLASLIITINRGLASGERVSLVLGTESALRYPEETEGGLQVGKAREAVEAKTADMSDVAANHSGPDTATSDKVSHSSDLSSADAVSFRDVTFTYPGAAAPSLSHISFTVKKGETLGIIGGTGSGKTSLVDLIPRFYDVDEGQVLVNGLDVKDYPRGRLTDHIALVPQRAQLFTGTIRENLKWGNDKATDEALEKALSIAQATDVVRSKEDGLDARVEQGGRNFSGGQRQRLTIARALVSDPEILILDDSASALDMVTDARLRRALREELPGKTVILVSQRTSTLRQADHILVLEDGALAGDGSHEELMQSCPVYREIHYSQNPEERPATDKAPKRPVDGKRLEAGSADGTGTTGETLAGMVSTAAEGRL